LKLATDNTADKSDKATEENPQVREVMNRLSLKRKLTDKQHPREQNMMRILI